MKLWHFLVFLAFAFIVGFAGALFKIMHWPHSDTILVLAFVLKVLAIILLAGKLLTHPKIKEFLNW